MLHTIFPIKPPVVALIGPTAIGKTALSIELAKQFNFEIISVDSMQVYKYMDIGTAKITQDEMEGIRHHLIDVVTPEENFDAVAFEKLAIKAIQEILSRGKRVLLTGGTGLYLKSLVEGLSQDLPAFPEIRAEIQEQLQQIGNQALHDKLVLIDGISAKRIHKNDTQRVTRGLEIYHGTGKPWSQLLKEHNQSKQLRFPNFHTVALTCNRKDLYKQIGLRSELMIKGGFEEEVRMLLQKGYGLQHKSMRSIGYSHMVKYLQGDWDFDKMTERLTRDTRRYAKRQFTWFNKIDSIHWVEKGDIETIPSLVKSFLHSY
jgi:tRNA dimethylallyltransferase